MGILETIFLGTIFGLTEFLPVSSVAHIALFKNLTNNTEKSEIKLFYIIMQLGTLLSIIILYRRELVLSLKNIFFRNHLNSINKKDSAVNKSYNSNLFLFILISAVPLLLFFIPIPFLSMKNYINVSYNIYNKNILIIAFSSFLSAILIFISLIAGNNIEKKYKDKGFNNSYLAGRKRFALSDIFIIGFINILVMILPGLSRIAVYISAFQIRGISKNKSADYSFILSIPFILFAIINSIIDIGENGFSFIFKVNFFSLILALVLSFLIGIMSMKLFKWLLFKNKMMMFVSYLTAFGIVFLIGGLINIF